MTTSFRVLVLAALACLLVACGGGAKPEAAPEKAAGVDVAQQLDGCASCHKPSKLPLDGIAQDELLGKLKAIRDGAQKHPSKMSDLDDAQLEAIAKALGAK